MVQQTDTATCTNSYLESHYDQYQKAGNILAYLTIILRDFTILSITVIFLIKIGRRENSLKE